MTLQDIPPYLHWILLIGLVLIIFNSTQQGINLFDSITNTVLNFDSGLKDQIKNFETNKQTGMTQNQYFFNWLIIISYLYIYYYIFKLVSSFSMQGIIGNLFFTGVTIMLFHLMYFIFLNKQGLSVDIIMDAFPFTGLFYFIKQLILNTDIFKMQGLIDQAQSQTSQSILNQSNTTTTGTDFDLS